MHSQMLEKIPQNLKKNWTDFSLPKKNLPSEDAILQHKLQQGESILLISVNGFFLPELSEMHKLPGSLLICDLQTALEKHSELINSIPNLQTSFTDGLFVYLPDHFILTCPIHFLSLVIDDNQFITQPQHIIRLGHHSKLTFIEEYFSFSEQAYLMNTITTMLIGKNAELVNYKIQQEGKKALHLSHHVVVQMQDSRTSFTNITSGSAFTRDELIIKLQEQGAHCQTAGLYYAHQDNQQIEYHIDIDHIAPYSESSMLYKGILENKSQAIFNGRVHVAKDAQKTLAYQANHNLLLSREAEVYSKPFLEIYADDVKCKHGATIGQLDQAALFYLRSRGIDDTIAKSMLLQGFAEEILQRMTHSAIKTRAQTILETLVQA